LAGHLTSEKAEITLTNVHPGDESHTCVKILNSGKSIVGIDNFWHFKPKSIPRIRQITDKNFLIEILW
jgi:hypothetical protein